MGEKRTARNLPLELRGCYIPITLIYGMERLRRAAIDSSSLGATEGQRMSDPQAVASGSPDRRWSRVKGFRAALWSYLTKPWTKAPEEDRASVRIREMLQRSEASDIDELANDVCRLMQAVPDDCEHPQAVLFELAQQVQDRKERKEREGSGSVTTASTVTTASSAEGERLVQNAFRALDPEAQKIMLVHLSAGSYYIAIAEQLNMEPATVLRVLTKAYVQLRWHTETVDPAAARALPP